MDLGSRWVRARLGLGTAGFGIAWFWVWLGLGLVGFGFGFVLARRGIILIFHRNFVKVSCRHKQMEEFELYPPAGEIMFSS